MTWTLQIDSDGDLVLNSRKQLIALEDTAKAVQDIAVILKSLIGSYHLNTNFGTDHLAMIEANRNTQVIQNEVRKALSSYTALTLDSVACSFGDDRTLTIAVSGTLNTGDAISLEVTL